jgi:hypothetical protein
MSATATKCQFDYTNYLRLKVTRGGNWFHCFRDWLKAFGIEQATLLADLLNYAKARADSAGWVMCTEKWLRDGLGLSRDDQQRVLHCLATTGVLEIEWRGGSRFIRIKTTRIEELVGK